MGVGSSEYVLFILLTCVSVNGEKLFSVQYAVHHSGAAAVCGVVSVRRGDLHHRRSC